MIVEIRPVGRVNASIVVPGSKSITNRALVCASMAKGDSEITNPSDSDDSALLVNGLNQLGVLVRRSGENRESSHGRWIVEGTGGVLYAPRFPIPVGNAGTTLRFLLSLSAFARGLVVLEGSERMAGRPAADLLAALRSNGIVVNQREGTARFEVQGGGFRGGTVNMSGAKSSQFISSILMVAPLARDGVEINVSGHLTSASYVDLTIEVMQRFGVRVDRDGGRSFRVLPGQSYHPASLAVEPDASGATYAYAAAAIAGGRACVKDLPKSSTQGDARFVDVLKDMGCVEKEQWLEREGNLRGIDVDMNAMPDAVPTLTAVALFAEGVTRIRNVGQLRYKESDRLEALRGELGKLGADLRLHEDGLEVHPIALHGAHLDPHDDHRLAMSFALIGLRVPGIAIENPDCVRKSFPRFWTEFAKFSETVSS